MTMSEQRRAAWQGLQGMAVPSAQDIQQQNAANHCSGMHVGGAAHAQRVYDSSDALLAGLLREVLQMVQVVEALRGEVADLRAEIRDKAQAQVVAFPGTALRHGTPR